MPTKALPELPNQSNLRSPAQPAETPGRWEIKAVNGKEEDKVTVREPSPFSLSLFNLLRTAVKQTLDRE